MGVDTLSSMYEAALEEGLLTLRVANTFLDSEGEPVISCRPRCASCGDCELPRISFQAPLYDVAVGRPAVQSP